MIDNVFTNNLKDELRSGNIQFTLKPRKDLKSFVFPVKKPQTLLLDFEITTLDLINAMKSMKSSSAPGPDDLPAIFFRRYAEVLATPLEQIWRRSLDTGKMPDTTLLAIITPIYKGGDKSEPANYRPVALTNHIMKIFERVMRVKLVEHLNENGYTNATQHGFKEGHSTVTQILEYMDSVLNILERGKEADVIYLDLAKVFDKVDHNILLFKLYELGVRRKVLTWITQFLKNRKQVVRINGHISDHQWVVSGVPQGSVLGPLLFIIMMIDINHFAKSGLLSYADDTKIWMSADERENLQKELDKICRWIEENNMLLNGKKFEQLPIGKKGEQNIFKTHEDQEIERKTEVKDLGVFISDDMKFNYHISQMVGKGKRLANWALRTFRTRKTFPLKIVLKSLIVPILEYASVVWSPNNATLIDLIESVQASFTSRMEEFNTFDEELGMNVCTTKYWERLKKLKIYSHQRRRERYMIIFMYKIMIGAYPNPGFDLLSTTYDERNGIKVKPREQGAGCQQPEHPPFSTKDPNFSIFFLVN